MTINLGLVIIVWGCLFFGLITYDTFIVNDNYQLEDEIYLKVLKNNISQVDLNDYLEIECQRSNYPDTCKEYVIKKYLGVK